VGLVRKTWNLPKMRDDFEQARTKPQKRTFSNLTSLPTALGSRVYSPRTHRSKRRRLNCECAASAYSRLRRPSDSRWG